MSQDFSPSDRLNHRRCLRAYLQSLEARAQDGTRRAEQQTPREDRPRLPLPAAMTPPRSTIPSDQFGGLDAGILSPEERSSRTRDQSDTGESPDVIQARVPDASVPRDGSDSPEFNRNPLVDNGESYARDTQGKFWYMGPTSSWAFCRRVLAFIGSHMPRPEPPVYPWDLETIDLTWTPIGFHQQPDVSGLPSHEYALYLLSTVQYHLGSLYEIIDDESFRKDVDRFYEDPARVAMRSRFWYSQFLLVLAFGEAFINTGSAKSVPGINYASRALSLIPSLIPLDQNKESLAAAQAQCLAALYLQALDLRLMSFQIIGQALRLAVIEGWHRHMPPETVGEHHSKRCNTIFWISYIIDREYGPLVGAPSSIRDEDITTKLPSEMDNSSKAEALTLQIRLSRLTATILTDSFLPFQMETVFSSVFLLYVIDAVSPGFVPDQTWHATAHGIFDMMITRGSPGAPLRKRELQRLEQIMTSYLRSGSQTNVSPLQFQEDPILAREMGVDERTSTEQGGYVSETSPWGLLGSQGGLIMSPGQILQLAEELDMEDFMVAP
ncbi:hypothetical protein FDECE_6162 [Fusarium decemcellulare]|nr:hypothetical protein FDECE_6162 [Fusarium decemcellulare]